MKINRIKIDKLYGYFNKDITFNDDISLLVGINGSGKTSVLNIINWIISPSMANLCITDFRSVNLWITFKDKEYEIICTHSQNIFNYQVKTIGKTYHPLKVNLSRSAKSIPNDEIIRTSLVNNYISLGPDKNEASTWALVKSFPSPTIIGLDRYMYTEESAQKLYIEENNKINLKKKTDNNISPIERVKEMVNVEYRKRKNNVLNLTNSLKNQLMLSAFDGNITADTLTSGIRYRITPGQIEKAEARVKDYFQNFEKDSLAEKEAEIIANYFRQLKEITRAYHTDDKDPTIKLLYALNVHQFIKIRNLLKEFEKFEKDSNNVMIEIQSYLDTLNYFFKDSSKKILFNDETFEITFNNLDKNGDAITEFKEINFLSSGEKQLLILFSYVAFNSQNGKIFIIDEPELSLHIKWQEDFLQKLEAVTPKNTQLILATHSPILANKKRQKAITLLSYNE